MEVIGFSNYLIYPDGRVWSRPRPLSKGGFLKGRNNSTGYPMVQLSNDVGQKNHLIHRLVAVHYIPNLENKPNVDHINRDTSDFRVENLRWVTQLENCQNQGISKKNTSGIKNIQYDKRNDIWKFGKRINGKLFTKCSKSKGKVLWIKFSFMLLNKINIR